ncbi:hypothetical protein Tcan_11852, partial [Toxocara canis]
DICCFHSACRRVSSNSLRIHCKGRRCSREWTTMSCEAVVNVSQSLASWKDTLQLPPKDLRYKTAVGSSLPLCLVRFVELNQYRVCIVIVIDLASGSRASLVKVRLHV